MTSSSSRVKTSPQDTQVNRGQAAAGDQSLHAWLKEWRDRETMRILCCKEASPDEIQMMFTKLKEREEAFEKCLHAFQYADPPKQPVDEPNDMISAFFQSHKAKNSKWAACPSCGCSRATGRFSGVCSVRGWLASEMHINGKLPLQQRYMLSSCKPRPETS